MIKGEDVKSELRKDRNTGVEFYRLLCFFLVLLSHQELVFFPRSDFTSCVLGWSVFMSFFVTLNGINVHGFYSISGFFGVGRKWKKIFMMACMVWFYSIVEFFLSFFLEGRHDVESIIHSVFPLMTGKYWYATAYMTLLVLSPFINRITDDVNAALTTGLLFIGIPSILYWGPNSEYSTDYVVMICYYTVIQYLSQSGFIGKITTKWIVLIVCTAFSVAVLLNFLTTYLMGARMPFGYFMPFSRGCSINIFLVSLGLFELFRRSKIHGRLWNMLAGYVFPAYILENVTGMIISRFYTPAINTLSVMERVVSLLFIICMTFCLSIVIETIRRGLFRKFEDLLYERIANFCKRLFVVRRS